MMSLMLQDHVLPVALVLYVDEMPVMLNADNSVSRPPF